jgi:hypothetical protein
MAITKINSLGVNLSSPLTFSAGTVSLPSITFSGDTNTGVFSPTADTIGFTEGGTEAMRITSDGNALIGTTSLVNTDRVVISGAKTLNAGIPRQQLTVVDSTALGADVGGAINFSGRFTANDFTVYGTISALKDDATSGNYGGYLQFKTRLNGNDNIERMKISSGGDLILIGSTAQKASGTSWSNPSDTRLKDNKQNYTKGLNELLQINVKTWEWNGKAGTTEGTTGIGVIADEIETILPNTIDTYKAKLNEDDTEETDVKRFDATEITWLLLNSVKEQQAIIEQLKARLTALESK